MSIDRSDSDWQAWACAKIDQLLCEITKPAVLPESSITIGTQVEAAFRLFDVLPFPVRQDISKLIYLYLQNPSEYNERKKMILINPPRVEPPP